MIDFYEEPNDPGAPAVIAALALAGLVAIFAVLLIAATGTSADGAAQTNNAPAVRAERYPAVSDKYAPFRQIEPDGIQRAHLAPCQGEGLIDGSVAATANLPTGYCEPVARPAGDDEGGSLYPTGDGSVDPVNNY